MKQLSKVAKKIGAIALTAIVATQSFSGNVFAYSNSVSGTIGNDGVKYSYSDTGVLKIGTQSETLDLYYEYPSTLFKNEVGEDASINPDDIKTLIITKKINSLDSNWFYNQAWSNLENIIIEEGVTKLGNFIRLEDSPKVDSITIPNTVTAIDYGMISAYGSVDHDVKIVIPSTVNTIAEGSITLSTDSSKEHVTIVCEKNSSIYNYAVLNGYRVELIDAATQCDATLDNDISWNIVAPEDLTFEYSNNGWIANTWVGVQGTLAAGSTLKITTDKKFSILGATKPDVQDVSVSSNNDTSAENGDSIITSLVRSNLENESVSVSGVSGNVYKINYKCVCDSPTLARQTYKGTVNFLVREIQG